MAYTAGADEWSDLHNVLGYAKSFMKLRDLFINLFTKVIYTQKLFQRIQKLISQYQLDIFIQLHKKE